MSEKSPVVLMMLWRQGRQKGNKGTCTSLRAVVITAKTVEQAKEKKGICQEWWSEYALRMVIQNGVDGEHSPAGPLVMEVRGGTLMWR